MTAWLAAFAASFAMVAIVVPRAHVWGTRPGRIPPRHAATQRARGRRPTDAGIVAIGAVTSSSLIGGVSDASTRATLLVCALALLATLGGTEGWPKLAMALAAAAVPLAGVTLDLTPTHVVNLLITGLGAFLVIRGVVALDAAEGVAACVASVSAVALLLLTVRGSGTGSATAAAVAGASLGLVAHLWPSSDLRMGRAGPIAIGGALATSAIAMDPASPAPRSALLPLLVVAVPLTAAFVGSWCRRLKHRGLRPHVWLPLAALAGSGSAVALDRGAIQPVIAVAIAAAAILPLWVVAARERRNAPLLGRYGVPVLAGAGLLVLGGAATGAVTLLHARQDMDEGRTAAEEGLDAARRGDLEGAQARFELAKRAFDQADDALGSPLLRFGDLLPILAPNLHSARTLAESGRDLADTAVIVAQRGGANDLRVVDGTIPIEPMRETSADLRAAVTALRQAADSVDGADSPYLLSDVRDANDRLHERIDEAEQAISVAAEATQVLPALLGADGPTHMFVAVLAPSELRAAGGIVGNFAEIQADHGHVTMVRTGSVGELNDAIDDAQLRAILPVPYRAEFAGFFPQRHWQNLSATADIPTMGQATAAGYPLAGGPPIDAMITIDPVGQAALLKLTGPITVPGWPEPITAENAVEVLSHDHYVTLTDTQREQFQSGVVKATFDALTTGVLPDPTIITSTLAPAVATGHLRLWSPARATQHLFERMGADGALSAGPGDFVELVTQNGSASKIDWYLQRSMTYRAEFDPGTGHVAASAEVTLTNRAPTSGLPAYVIGGNDVVAPGENRIYVTIYTPLGVSGVFDSDGNELAVTLGRERGLRSATVLTTIAPGGTTGLRFELEGELSRSETYHVRIGKQPTLRPDTVTASISAPVGWAVGGAKTTTLEHDQDVNLEATFSRP